MTKKPIKEISEAKKKMEAAKKRQEEAQKPLDQRLREANTIGVIFAQNNLDNLIYTTPILKRIFFTYNVEITLYMSPVYNESYLQLMGELPYVNAIKTFKDQAINEDLIMGCEAENDVVILLSYPMAYQQFLQRGLNVTQAMATLIGLKLGEDSLNLEIGVLGDYMEKAEKALTEAGVDGEYIVIAPHQAPNLPPHLQGPRAYPLELWLETLSQLDDNNIKCVIIGDSSFNEPVIPVGISDNLIPIYSADYTLLTGIIMKSQGIIAINDWPLVVARAVKKKIIQIHSGCPLTWDGAFYTSDSSNKESARILSSISIRSIWPENIVDTAKELFNKKCESKSVQKRKKVQMTGKV